MCMTGNGMTVTIDPGGGAAPIIGRIIRMGEWTEEVPLIDDNDLSLADGDHEKKCVGGVIQHGEWEFDGVFQPGTTTSTIPTLANKGTILITYPAIEGESAGATTSGDGWLLKRGRGPFETNQRVEGGYALAFEGGSGGITETAGTATP